MQVGTRCKHETRVRIASFQRLKLTLDELLLKYALNFHLRPYDMVSVILKEAVAGVIMVGQCRLKGCCHPY